MVYLYVNTHLHIYIYTLSLSLVSVVTLLSYIALTNPHALCFYDIYKRVGDIIFWQF